MVFLFVCLFVCLQAIENRMKREFVLIVERESIRVTRQ